MPLINKKITPDKSTTSWEAVGKWYNDSVGHDGHYYHQNIIIPGVIRLMNIEQGNNASILDLACGQGILSRHIPPGVDYYGFDLSHSLIQAAKQYEKTHHFAIADVSKPLPLQKMNFSHATVILALQNIESALPVFKNAYKHLQNDGSLIIVINHPSFRIPRQSSWKVDEDKKIQYRRIDRYFTSMKIPIQMHPGKGKTSPNTWSFHYPLSTYTQWLFEAGFNIEIIEEWCSNKMSTGKMAKMENRSREEFPLFLTIRAKKRSLNKKEGN